MALGGGEEALGRGAGDLPEGGTGNLPVGGTGNLPVGGRVESFGCGCGVALGGGDDAPGCGTARGKAFGD